MIKINVFRQILTLSREYVLFLSGLCITRNVKYARKKQITDMRRISNQIYSCPMKTDHVLEALSCGISKAMHKLSIDFH